MFGKLKSYIHILGKLNLLAVKKKNKQPKQLVRGKKKIQQFSLRFNKNKMVRITTKTLEVKQTQIGDRYNKIKLV